LFLQKKKQTKKKVFIAAQELWDKGDVFINNPEP